MRRPTLLAVAIAGVLAGCGSSNHTSSSDSPVASTRSSSTSATASATRANSRTAASPSPLQVARTFTVAYVHYLDASLPALALPDATARVRAQPGQLMPGGARRGRLAVQSVAQVPGGSTFITQLADRAHRFTVQLTVASVSGRGLVVGVMPPDFDSLVGPPTRALPQPAGSTAPATTARRFLRGYLPWLYGRGPVTAIAAATGAVLAALKAHPPNIPPSMHGLDPRLAALGMQRHGGAWKALANVTDGRETYELILTLKQTRRRWFASAVGEG
jgi:hypothetical protein